MRRHWKIWLVGGAGVIVGLIIGMILGHNASVELNEWLQGVGTLVGAITTTVAVVAAVMAYRSDREFQTHQIEESREETSDRRRARIEMLLQDARRVNVRPSGTMTRKDDGSHHLTSVSALYANGGSRPIRDLRWRVPPYLPEWHSFRKYIRPGLSSFEPMRVELTPSPLVLPPGERLQDNLEVRFELEGTQWASRPSGDPWVVGPDDDQRA